MRTLIENGDGQCIGNDNVQFEETAVAKTNTKRTRVLLITALIVLGVLIVLAPSAGSNGPPLQQQAAAPSAINEEEDDKNRGTPAPAAQRKRSGQTESAAQHSTDGTSAPVHHGESQAGATFDGRETESLHAASPPPQQVVVFVEKVQPQAVPHSAQPSKHHRHKPTWTEYVASTLNNSFSEFVVSAFYDPDAFVMGYAGAGSASSTSLNEDDDVVEDTGDGDPATSSSTYLPPKFPQEARKMPAAAGAESRGATHSSPSTLQQKVKQGTTRRGQFIYSSPMAIIKPFDTPERQLILIKKLSSVALGRFHRDASLAATYRGLKTVEEFLALDKAVRMFLRGQIVNYLRLVQLVIESIPHSHALRRDLLELTNSRETVLNNHDPLLLFLSGVTCKKATKGKGSGALCDGEATKKNSKLLETFVEELLVNTGSKAVNLELPYTSVEATLTSAIEYFRPPYDSQGPRSQKFMSTLRPSVSCTHLDRECEWPDGCRFYCNMGYLQFGQQVSSSAAPSHGEEQQPSYHHSLFTHRVLSLGSNNQYDFELMLVKNLNRGAIASKSGAVGGGASENDNEESFGKPSSKQSNEETTSTIKRRSSSSAATTTQLVPSRNGIFSITTFDCTLGDGFLPPKDLQSSPVGWGGAPLCISGVGRIRKRGGGTMRQSSNVRPRSTGAKSASDRRPVSGRDSSSSSGSSSSSRRAAVRSGEVQRPPHYTTIPFTSVKPFVLSTEQQLNQKQRGGEMETESALRQSTTTSAGDHKQWPKIQRGAANPNAKPPEQWRKEQWRQSVIDALREQNNKQKSSTSPPPLFDDVSVLKIDIEAHEYELINNWASAERTAMMAAEISDGGDQQQDRDSPSATTLPQQKQRISLLDFDTILENSGLFSSVSMVLMEIHGMGMMEVKDAVSAWHMQFLLQQLHLLGFVQVSLEKNFFGDCCYEVVFVHQRYFVRSEMWTALQDHG